MLKKVIGVIGRIIGIKYILKEYQGVKNAKIYWDMNALNQEFKYMQMALELLLPINYLINNRILIIVHTFEQSGVKKFFCRFLAKLFFTFNYKCFIIQMKLLNKYLKFTN